MKTILHLCADTGSDSKPYQLNGYNVILVGSAIGVENYEPPEDVYGVFANPPCTEFGVPASQSWVDNAKPFTDTLKANSDTVVKSFYWSAGEWYNSDTVYKEVHKPLQ
jgi:hypothetical protein